MKQERLKELEGLCKSGSSFKRSVSVWNGDEVKEKQDADWAKKKHELLKEERKALRDEDVKTAKRINLNLKLHEQKRLLPTKKRKLDKSDKDQSGQSPILKKQTTSKQGLASDKPPQAKIQP